VKEQCVAPHKFWDQSFDFKTDSLTLTLEVGVEQEADSDSNYVHLLLTIDRLCSVTDSHKHRQSRAASQSALKSCRHMSACNSISTYTSSRARRNEAVDKPHARSEIGNFRSRGDETLCVSNHLTLRPLTRARLSSV
jgi:hypothetical protein